MYLLFSKYGLSKRADLKNMHEQKEKDIDDLVSKLLEVQHLFPPAKQTEQAKMGPIYSTTTDPNVHKFSRARWSHLHTTTTHLAAAGNLT